MASRRISHPIIGAWIAVLLLSTSVSASGYPGDDAEDEDLHLDINSSKPQIRHYETAHAGSIMAKTTKFRSADEEIQRRLVAYDLDPILPPYDNVFDELVVKPETADDNFTGAREAIDEENEDESHNDSNEGEDVTSADVQSAERQTEIDITPEPDTKESESDIVNVITEETEEAEIVVVPETETLVGESEAIVEQLGNSDEVLVEETEAETIDSNDAALSEVTAAESNVSDVLTEEVEAIEEETEIPEEVATESSQDEETDATDRTTSATVNETPTQEEEEVLVVVVDSAVVDEDAEEDMSIIDESKSDDIAATSSTDVGEVVNENELQEEPVQDLSKSNDVEDAVASEEDKTEEENADIISIPHEQEPELGEHLVEEELENTKEEVTNNEESMGNNPSEEEAPEETIVDNTTTDVSLETEGTDESVEIDTTATAELLDEDVNDIAQAGEEENNNIEESSEEGEPTEIVEDVEESSEENEPTENFEDVQVADVERSSDEEEVTEIVEDIQVADAEGTPDEEELTEIVEDVQIADVTEAGEESDLRSDSAMDAVQMNEDSLQSEGESTAEVSKVDNEQNIQQEDTEDSVVEVNETDEVVDAVVDEVVEAVDEFVDEVVDEIVDDVNSADVEPPTEDSPTFETPESEVIEPADQSEDTIEDFDETNSAQKHDTKVEEVSLVEEAEELPIDEEDASTFEPQQQQQQQQQQPPVPKPSANDEFVRGLDDLHKFLEEVDPPDELDVGAAGLSMQEVLMGQGVEIIKTRVEKGLGHVQRSARTLKTKGLQKWNGFKEVLDDQFDVNVDGMALSIVEKLEGPYKNAKELTSNAIELFSKNRHKLDGVLEVVLDKVGKVISKAKAILTDFGILDSDYDEYEDEDISFDGLENNGNDMEEMRRKYLERYN